jgi:hypothetical protein
MITALPPEDAALLGYLRRVLARKAEPKHRRAAGVVLRPVTSGRGPGYWSLKVTVEVWQRSILYR